MNQEQYSSIVGVALSISGGSPIIPPENSFAPGSDEDFQKLLLRLAAKAAERPDAHALIQLFCQATREFFQVSGVYFWRCDFADELVGEFEWVCSVVFGILSSEFFPSPTAPLSIPPPPQNAKPNTKKVLQT